MVHLQEGQLVLVSALTLPGHVEGRPHMCGRRGALGEPDAESLAMDVETVVFNPSGSVEACSNTSSPYHGLVGRPDALNVSKLSRGRRGPSWPTGQPWAILVSVLEARAGVQELGDTMVHSARLLEVQKNGGERPMDQGSAVLG